MPTRLPFFTPAAPIGAATSFPSFASSAFARATWAVALSVWVAAPTARAAETLYPAVTVVVSPTGWHPIAGVGAALPATPVPRRAAVRNRPQPPASPGALQAIRNPR